MRDVYASQLFKIFAEVTTFMTLTNIIYCHHFLFYSTKCEYIEIPSDLATYCRYQYVR